MMRVYGSRISYYTGKLEAYLRYRGIDYDLLPTVGNEKRLKAGAGVVQMPVVECDDGRWMTDSTPIIAWLDTRQPTPSIYPQDPALRFIALLIEDYADEWLWRPAMHYRWSYRRTRDYAAETLYAELIAGTRPIPRWLGARLLRKRQRGGFVTGDGVSAATRAHVEGAYFAALTHMQAILETRPFVLGDRPTIADFGLMGPMLRHFGQDPEPADIMRARAPAVYEWVARMWNAKAGRDTTGLVATIDGPVAALLAEICATHLAQLRQNADAWTNGIGRYDQRIQDCDYRNVPTSRYRVWCLEELRREWAALDDDARAGLRPYLTGEAAILWGEAPFAPSGYDPDRGAPFNRAINVFANGVPQR